MLQGLKADLTLKPVYSHQLASKAMLSSYSSSLGAFSWLESQQPSDGVKGQRCSRGPTHNLAFQLVRSVWEPQRNQTENQIYSGPPGLDTTSSVFSSGLLSCLSVSDDYCRIKTASHRLPASNRRSSTTTKTISHSPNVRVWTSVLTSQSKDG